MGFYSHLITMKDLHSYLNFAKRAFKKLGFYLHFEKKSDLALKSGIPYDGMHFYFRKKNHETW